MNEVNNVVSNGRSKMYKEPDIMFIMNDVNLKKKILVMIFFSFKGGCVVCVHQVMIMQLNVC